MPQRRSSPQEDKDEHSISYSTPTTCLSAGIKYNPWVLIEFISIPGLRSITQSKVGWLSKEKGGWILVKQEVEVNSLMAADSAPKMFAFPYF